MTSYIYDMVDTWNNGATTFTSIKMNVTDTASNAASLLMDLQVGGSSKFSVRKDGRAYGTLFGADNANALFFAGGLTYLYAGNSTPFAVSSTTAIIVNGNNLGFSSGTSADLILSRRAAANLRLGAADAAAPVAQTLSVQSVVAGTSNTAGANLTITGSQGTGTGAGGSIVFQVAPAGSSGTAQNALVTALTIAGTGQVTFSQTANFSNDLGFASGTQLTFSGNGVIRWPSAGVLRLSNAAVTDFNRLQFGGTTSSFPALKRNSTALETKLADDSAYAPHAMQYLDVTDGVTAPASATDRARIYVDTADGDLKVIFADGTVKTIVTDT